MYNDDDENGLIGKEKAEKLVSLNQELRVLVTKLDITHETISQLINFSLPVACRAVLGSCLYLGLHLRRISRLRSTDTEISTDTITILF